MTERSAVHDTFVIQRTYEATPQRVFTLANSGGRASGDLPPLSWRILSRSSSLSIRPEQQERDHRPLGNSNAWLGRATTGPGLKSAGFSTPSTTHAGPVSRGAR